MTPSYKPRCIYRPALHGYFRVHAFGGPAREGEVRRLEIGPYDTLDAAMRDPPAFRRYDFWPEPLREVKWVTA